MEARERYDRGPPREGGVAVPAVGVKAVPGADPGVGRVRGPPVPPGAIGVAEKPVGPLAKEQGLGQAIPDVGRTYGTEGVEDPKIQVSEDRVIAINLGGAYVATVAAVGVGHRAVDRVGDGLGLTDRRVARTPEDVDPGPAHSRVGGIEEMDVEVHGGEQRRLVELGQEGREQARRIDVTAPTWQVEKASVEGRSHWVATDDVRVI